MGLVAGLIFIVVGIVYVVSKYLTQDTGATGGVTAIVIAIGALGLWLLSQIAGAIEAMGFIGYLFLLVFVGVPMLIGLGKLIFGDIKNATKDGIIRGEITNITTSTSEQTILYPRPTEVRDIETIRSEWFFRNDEYLTAKDAIEKYLAKGVE